MKQGGINNMVTEANIKSYKLSNSIDKVKLNRFKKTYANKILNCKSLECRDRAEAAYNLILYLSNRFKMTAPELLITNKPRKQYGNKQTYGFYIPKQHRIVIYNLTAKQHKPISIKSLYETLLHEFIHAYDHKVLNIDSSYHTNGFYNRLKDLTEKLK